MKISEIEEVLSLANPENTRRFFDKNSIEFTEYKKSISKKGSSIHFNVQIDKDFTFSRTHLSHLVDLFLNETINELELNYIVDNILSATDSFESDDIFEKLGYLTDPETNGNVTRDNIRDLIQL